MNTTKIVQTVKNVPKFAKRHSPEILTGLGIVGMITATVTAVKATPKALRRIDEEDAVTPVEIVKATWKCYIPSVVIGIVSIGCLVGANSVNTKRNAALATAYALSESTLKEYQEKVVEKIGEKKEKEVRDEIAKDKIMRNPVVEDEIIETGMGETRCYDVISGRYFKSDIERLRRAENDLNRQMRYDMYISLNEFYDAINLDHIKIGDDLGWNIDSTGYIELRFSSHLDHQGRPCLVMDYVLAPQYDYHR